MLRTPLAKGIYVKRTMMIILVSALEIDAAYFAWDGLLMVGRASIEIIPSRTHIDEA